MCEDRVQDGRRRLAVVVWGCVSLGHQPLQAMRHVDRLRALYFCRERDIKEEIVRPGKRKIGRCRKLKDRMLCLNTSFQRTLSSMVVFRRFDS